MRVCVCVHVRAQNAYATYKSAAPVTVYKMGVSAEVPSTRFTKAGGVQPLGLLGRQTLPAEGPPWPPAQWWRGYSLFALLSLVALNPGCKLKSLIRGKEEDCQQFQRLGPPPRILI